MKQFLPPSAIHIPGRLRKAQLTVMIGLVVGIGVVIIVAIHASGTPIAFEAESGTLGGTASTTTTTGASGNGAVRFTKGVPMPVADLPAPNGATWKHIYGEDFTGTPDLPIGAFQVDSGGVILPTAPAYARFGSTIKFYPDGANDTHKIAQSWASKTISVNNNDPGANGVLDIFLHTETIGGVQMPMAAWLRPVYSGETGHTPYSQLYGRWAFRMRAAPGVAGFGQVALTIADPWPDNGEQDIWEGGTNKNMEGNYHYASPNGGVQNVQPATAKSNANWHTAVAEWSPGNIKWYYDGELVLNTTKEVPTAAHKFDIQSGGAYTHEQGRGGSMTAGSAVLTIPTPVLCRWTMDAFTSADVGRTITVAGAGAGGKTLTTTIASYQSTTQVTLAAAAATTVNEADLAITVRSASAAAISSGSKSLTLASGSFTDADVQQQVSVPGAGPGGSDLRSIIASRQSATTVTLTSAASTTVTGATVTFRNLVTSVSFTNGSHTISNPSGNFINGIVGKPITIYGAGNGGAPLYTTVTARLSSTQITVADAATSTGTNAYLDGVPNPLTSGHWLIDWISIWSYQP